jgi:hypothetical protein
MEEQSVYHWSLNVLLVIPEATALNLEPRLQVANVMPDSSVMAHPRLQGLTVHLQRLESLVLQEDTVRSVPQNKRLVKVDTTIRIQVERQFSNVHFVLQALTA